MGFQLLTGTVSHTERGSETNISVGSGAFGTVRGRGSTWQILSLRIDGRQVEYKCKGTMPAFSEGDKAAAAGSERNGSVRALAVRNFTTGAVYHPSPLFYIIGGTILTVLSIPMMIFLIGFLILPFSLFFIYYGWRIQRALSAVRSASAPSNLSERSSSPSATRLSSSKSSTVE